MKKLAGTGFLKVTGILLIIVSSLGILLSVICMLSIVMMGSMFETEAAFAQELINILNNAGYQVSGINEAMAVYDYIMMIFSYVIIYILVCSIAYMIAGIIGIRNSRNQNGAKKCLIWGIIIAVLTVLAPIAGLILSGTINISFFITGLILPALFIIGAIKNKNHIAEPNYPVYQNY